MMRNIHDLRSYLTVLESAGQLLRITSPVALRHELANVAVTAARQGRGAVYFENPDHVPWPIFAGAVSSPALAALALGCAVDEVTGVMEAVQIPAHGISPIVKDTAAWKANVLTGDAIDLHALPIPVHGLHDGGPFITGGVTISKDPVSGRGNLSYNRMQVLGARTLGFNVNAWRDTLRFYKTQENQDKALHISIAIGLDPAIMIAAGCRSEDDELRIAGAIRGQGVPLCRGVTVDVAIPAEAEIVLEGYLPPHTRHLEGPLAEFHGYYGELWNSPVFEVTAICYRDAPIYQTIVPGAAEHIYLGNVLPREPLLLHFVRHVSKSVIGLHIPPYSNGFSVIVQTEKSNPGEPKNIALAAMMAHVNIKKVIVVGPDVNIYDPGDVLWALTNRVDWSQDVFTVPGAQGHEMDPTADPEGVHTKIGIDATYKPERRQYGERIRYPDVDLTKYK